MPLTENERYALWLRNREARLAKRAEIQTALRGSEAARARIQAAWRPLIPDPVVCEEPEDDPQIGNWNGP